MAISRRGSWTNADGLVVGFGPRYPERQATAAYSVDGASVELALDFTYASTSPALEMPAGFAVESVVLEVGTAWVGGTSLAIGDGTDPDGWFTDAQLPTASLTAGAVVVAGGAYAIGDAATNAALAKVYAAADTLDIVVTGTYTAGSARLVVRGRRIA